MNIKGRPTPAEIPVLEALKSRLPYRHKVYHKLVEDLAYKQKGFDGEKAVDRYTASLPQNNFTTLYDVYLKNKRSSFQIDTLIISPHCIYVIEIKNYVGTVTFDFILNQFTREYNGKVEGFRNPITQATTNKSLLTEWLTYHNILDIPIYTLVTISDPSTIIKIIPEDRDVSHELMHGEYMPQQVMKIDRELKGNRHGYLHQKVGALILGECRLFDFDYKRKYGINSMELLSGVQCPGCGRLGMQRGYKYWKCMHCGVTDKNAHIQAMHDYLLLTSPWMSNFECMQFLQVQSRHLVSRLLKTSNLSYVPARRKWRK